MSRTAIGIDLGTSNTCVAVWKNGRVESIPNKFGEFITPSWVSFTDREIIIGKTAKRNAYKNEHNTVFGIKRIIGRKFTDPAVKEAIRNWKFKIIEDRQNNPQIEINYKNDCRYYYPENVSALILTEMKNIAQSYIGDNEIVNAVITVPAYFNDHQRQATKDAAKIAGLNVLRLINEPTSAAIAYVYDKLSKSKQNVLVYDLGGGTFDVTILCASNDEIIVKATLGDATLGGLNFDQLCIQHFLKILKKKYNIDSSVTMKSRFLRRLEEQVERAKHDLSSSVSTSIELLAAYNDVDVNEEFSRARFDDLNEELYNKTIEIVEQCIKEAGLQNDDIDEIVLVGGSVRILKIQELLQDFFQKPLSRTINPDQAVAHGAAILAAYLNGALGNISLNITDVTSMSLGIEILNNEMNVLIPRNTQIPFEATCMYTTSTEDENAIRITILEGDSEYADQNLCLGTFDLLDLPKSPLVEVTFKVDVNGIVTVTAFENSSGIEKTINVYLNKGRLSELEIESAKNDCETIFEEGKKFQLVQNLRNEFESDLIKLEQAINRSNVNYQKKESNLLKINEFKLWMSSTEALVAENLIKQKLILSNLNMY